MVALLAEGVDRNSLKDDVNRQNELSPSSRRAWIEIALYCPGFQRRRVALLAEGVDRNCASLPVVWVPRVALLAEGVDRNTKSEGSAKVAGVALLAEGVDRNLLSRHPARNHSAGRPPRGGRG